jgi:hypothetical protein
VSPSRASTDVLGVVILLLLLVGIVTVVVVDGTEHGWSTPAIEGGR